MYRFYNDDCVMHYYCFLIKYGNNNLQNTPFKAIHSREK
nr:MAG TPA: hypothetical protein [Caudoviricetes sp.]